MEVNIQEEEDTGEPEETPEDDAHKSPLWMIIYTDLVSNLMIFFLMCYCLTWLSEQDRMIAAASMAEKFGGKKDEIAKVKKELENKEMAKIIETDRIENQVKEKFTNVEINAEIIKITLPSPVLFDSGKAELKKATYKSLSEIADIIRDLPNKMVVEGHTDNMPILSSREFQSNWELSTARAFSVIRYLIDNEDINPKRLSAYGYSEFRPKYPNDSPEHKQGNRRIEINIIKLKS